MVTSGVKRRPPIAIICLFFSAIKYTLNGDDCCSRCSSFKRVTENTSKGPATSKISTSSKIRIPTINGIFYSL